MKTLLSVTRYRCEFCKKEYARKFSCENHEKRCGGNPTNRTECSACEFFQQTEKIIDDDYVTLSSKAFYCKKKEVGIYPPVIVHRNIFKDNPHLFEEEIPMPLVGECADFEPGYPF